VSAISIQLGILAIAKDPERPDHDAIEIAAQRARAAGHRVVARQVIDDVEDSIRKQLTRWIAYAEIDVILVLGGAESEAVSSALQPLVSEVLPGFTDLFRWLMFQESGAAAALSSAEAARCDTTFVFVLPGAVEAAMDKLILPQFDPATKPRNLVSQMPRLRGVTGAGASAVSEAGKSHGDAAVPVAIPAEKTQGGSGVPARLPAVSSGVRARPRTGAHVIVRSRPGDDPPTRPIEVGRLEQQLAMTTSGPRHEDVTRPDLSRLPSVPPGADELEELQPDEEVTQTDLLAAPPRRGPPVSLSASTSAPTPASSARPGTASSARPLAPRAPGSTHRPATDSTRTRAPSSSAPAAASAKTRAASAPASAAPGPRLPSVVSSGAASAVSPVTIQPARKRTSDAPATARPRPRSSPPALPPRPPGEEASSARSSAAPAASHVASKPTGPASAPPPVPTSRAASAATGSTPVAPPVPAAPSRAAARTGPVPAAPPSPPTTSRSSASTGAVPAVPSSPQATSRSGATSGATSGPAPSASSAPPPPSRPASRTGPVASAPPVPTATAPPVPTATAASAPPRDKRASSPSPADIPASALTGAPAGTRDEAAPSSSTPARPRPASAPPAPPLPVPRAATESATELPRGTFTYPVKRRRISPLLVVLVIVAAAAIGFGAVVVFFGGERGRAGSPPQAALAAGPEAGAVGQVEDVVPANEGANEGANNTADASDAEPASDDLVTASRSGTEATASPELDMEPVVADTPRSRRRPARTSSRERPVTRTSTERVAAQAASTPPPSTEPAASPSPAPAGTSTSTPSTAPAPAPADDCDEAACVLGNYDKPCCARYRPSGTDLSRRIGGLPETLDKPMVRAGVQTVKARVVTCGEKSKSKGTVRIAMTVSPDGSVTAASVESAPDPALGSCVADAMRAARFGKSVQGGSFTYPFAF